MWEGNLTSQGNKSQVQISSVLYLRLSPDTHSPAKDDHRDIWPQAHHQKYVEQSTGLELELVPGRSTVASHCSCLCRVRCRAQISPYWLSTQQWTLIWLSQWVNLKADIQLVQQSAGLSLFSMNPWGWHHCESVRAWPGEDALLLIKSHMPFLVFGLWCCRAW